MKNDFMIHRIMAGVMSGALASLVMAFVIGIILFAPKPYPSIQPEVKANSSQPDGILKTYYWAGLLKEELNYERGLLQGRSFQFYPNGSVLRRLDYHQGKLMGEVVEFFEKPGRARGISRRYIAKNPPQAKIGVGKVKAIWHYAAGKREGTFVIYDKNGTIRKEGSYRLGKRHGIFRSYNKEGNLSSEYRYKEGKRFKEGSAELILESL